MTSRTITVAAIQSAFGHDMMANLDKVEALSEVIVNASLCARK